jgi:protein ImuB
MQYPCVACLDFPYGLPQDRLLALAEASLRFSSQVAVRPGESLFVELGRNRWLGSARGFAERLGALGRRFAPGAPPWMGLGRDAAEALALARWGRGQGPLEALPLEALTAYASPFGGDREVEAKLAELCAVLRSLGLSDLEGFLALPAQSLGSRFGPNAALLAGRLRGDFGMAWPRFRPAPKLEESLDLRDPATQDGCVSLDVLRFHMKRGLGLLCSRLRGRDLRAAALVLELKEESRSRADLQVRRLELRLSLPLGAPLELLKVLFEALEASLRGHGLAGPVVALRLRVTETAPALAAQRRFFERHEEEVEAWNTLVDRLAQRLGPDQVFLADLVRSYLPERAWKRCLREPGSARPPQEEGAPPSLGPRPSRLLPEPLVLARSGQALGPLADGRRWRAVSWDGPERLDGEWWQRHFSRDYWRVATDEGPDLWVFSRPQAPEGRFWLQGFFD